MDTDQKFTIANTFRHCGAHIEFIFVLIYEIHRLDYNDGMQDNRTQCLFSISGTFEAG